MESVENNCCLFAKHTTGFPQLLETPGKSWNFFFTFPGPGKSWKMTLLLETPGKLLEFLWTTPGILY
jgi:hypothetical protein